MHAGPHDDANVEENGAKAGLRECEVPHEHKQADDKVTCLPRIISNAISDIKDPEFRLILLLFYRSEAGHGRAGRAIAGHITNSQLKRDS